jgi:peroxiredoxin Q/BCP
MREFRALRSRFVASNVEVAGIALDSLERLQRTVKRLDFPFPMLADPERAAADAFGVIRRVGIAGWKLEFVRRATFLADSDGVIRATWHKLDVRRHAIEVLEAARALPPGNPRP